MKLFVGVDPGQKGAFSIVNEKSNLVDMWKMGDLSEMAGRLSVYQKSIHILLIEKAYAMPAHGRQQGAQGMFNYGKGYGKLLGMFEILEIPFDEILPTTWMTKLLSPTRTAKPGSSKQRSKSIRTEIRTHLPIYN